MSFTWLSGIKATLEKRKETKKAVEEVEDIKFERELEAEAQKVVDEFGVTLDTAKKYAAAQRRKKTIEENKEKRAEALKSFAERIGEGVKDADGVKEKGDPIKFIPPSFLPEGSISNRGRKKRKDDGIEFKPPSFL